MSLLAAVAPKAIGGLLGIFGARKARKQARRDAANKFVDLRNAAIAGGFNPLTALETTGGGGFGAYPSSSPPLASVELLTGATQDGVDEITGVSAQRRAVDRLNLDLARLKLDQARSGVVAYEPRLAAGSVGPPAPLNGSATRTVATTATWGLPLFGMVGNPLIGDREIKTQPASNTSGLMEIENTLTGGKITAPGDSEPWGIDELLTAAIVGAPQLALNWGDKLGTWAKNNVNGGVALQEIMERQSKESAKRASDKPKGTFWDYFGKAY